MTIPRAAKIDGSNLVLRDIQSEDEGDYICTVTNRGGSVTRKALLYVRGSYIIFSCTTSDSFWSIILSESQILEDQWNERVHFDMK